MSSTASVVALLVAACAAGGCLLTIDEGLIPGGGGGGGGGGGVGASSGAGDVGGGGGTGGAGGAEPAGSAHILYSDLESGPATGGQDDAGAFVTVFGLGFGAEQGDSFVTVGDGRASSIVTWSDTKIAFQLGPNAQSGDIVAHVAGDGASSPLGFTVRPGKIYFVDELGDDNDDGSFEAPFETITQCVAKLAPGGICYVHDGVVQTTDDNGAALVLAKSSQPGAPKALLSYPGELGRIASAGDHGIDVCDDATGCSDDGRWVLAGLRIEAPALAIAVNEVTGLRMVDCTVVCSSTTTAGDCVTIDQGASQIALLGNGVTVSEAPAATTPAAIFVGDGSGINVGWSTLKGPAAARGLAVEGASVIDLHDNFVTDVSFRGIDLKFFDATVGPIRVVNNVVSFSGDGTMDSACMAIGPSGGANEVEVEHNTLYDCAKPDGSCLDVRSSLTNVRNNVFFEPDDTLMVKLGGFPGSAAGATNLFAGTAAPPNNWMNNIVGDPAFEAPESNDFHLLPTSDAKDAGLDLDVPLDKDGRLRDAMPDLGAYEAP